MTDARAFERAKFLFYHDHKKDPEVIESVRGGLEQGNMLVFRAKKDGDVIKHVPNIHWQLIKDATDVRFEGLTQAQKEAYVRRSWDEHAAKVATTA
jgi:hypothetical protein